MSPPGSRTLLTTLLLLAATSAPAGAQRGGTLEITPLARYAFYPQSLELDNSFGVGAEVGLFLSRQLSLEFGGSYSMTTLPDSTSVTANSLTGRFLVHLPLQGRTTALLGIGYTRDRFSGDLDTEQQGPGGLIGFRFGLGPRLGLRLETTANYLLTQGDSSTRIWSVAAQVGMSLYAGPLGPRDTDRDGIPNTEDRCPGTPRGQPVDPTGCLLAKDSDADGVLDGGDRCPGTPAGQRVDLTGCNADLDGDGVPNYLDRCPATQPDTATDQFGCPLSVPLPDSDGDAVPDERDRCPGTRPDTPVDALGCPREVAAPAPPPRVILTDVTFATGSAVLTPHAEASLRVTAASLLEQPSVRLEVSGYTDDTGPRAFNEQLSLERARSVRAFLVRAGVPADQLTARGYGPADPIASNATAEGRADNRRVELHQIR